MPVCRDTWDSTAQGLAPSGEVHWNLVAPALIEAAIRRGEGQLGRHGAVLRRHVAAHRAARPTTNSSSRNHHRRPTSTGARSTSRSPRRSSRRSAPTSSQYLNGRDELFVQDLYCGADPKYRLSVRYVSPNAWQMAFVRNMFIRPEATELPTFDPNFTVLHAPEFEADPAKHGTRTGTSIVLNLAKRMILIGGTQYAGELKKAMFTVMNYYMPKQGVLSMHCSANIGKAGDTALFFGLSGTGKTTLSADPERSLIGDDEHGWSPNGAFNYEGGCYAKVINLSPEGEPDIYRTTQMFGTILENVVLDPMTRTVKFEDQSITENTRASYPLHYIPNYVPVGTRRTSEEHRLPHGRCVRRAAASREALPRTGDVLLPVRLHGEGGGHGARREGAAGHVLVLLRRGVPRLASDQVRRDARQA